jgi:hypothetical protein
LRLSVRAFDPPWNVGVAPTTAPEEDATVMLWPSGAMLVKAIETLPALAVSEVLSYFSWPSGLAARLSTCPVLAGAGVEDFVVLDFVVSGVVGVFDWAFGLAAAGRGAGAVDVDIDDVRVLDVLGLVGLLAGVEAGGLGAGAAAAGVLDVVAVTAAFRGVDAAVSVRFDEPPQPASASRPTASASVESLDTERRISCRPAWNLAVRSLSSPAAGWALSACSE